MSSAESAAAAMPMIDLGGASVSRLIYGSNPFFGFAHGTSEQAESMRDYFSDEQMVAENAEWVRRLSG